MKILTVEDNEINARLIDHILKELKFEYVHEIAEDAKTALELTALKQYDIILMDINLGDGLMDGTGVMMELRKLSVYQSTPIYAVTCYSLPGDKERFLNSGFNRYFSKPVNHLELLRAINDDLSAVPKDTF